MFAKVNALGKDLVAGHAQGWDGKDRGTSHEKSALSENL